MIRFLEKTRTNVTIAKGEIYQIIPDGKTPGRIVFDSASSSQPEDVRILSGGRIEGMKAGTATVTLKYHTTVKQEKVEYQTKINVSVIEPVYYYSALASSALPICISNENKTILRDKLNIQNCRDLMDYAEKNGISTLARETVSSDFTVRLWLHQAALFEIENMNADVALLAALVGVRNAADLSKVDSQLIKTAFKVSVPSAEAVNPDFRYPQEAVIDEILLQARELISVSNNRFSFVIDDEPAPYYLFGEISSNETENLRKGLAYLKNITIALPLPRIISGCVLLKGRDESDKDEPMRGCKVTLSGITNPARDRSEDDQDLYTYTDEFGKFYIIMPEKYNLHECVTFTITYQYTTSLAMTLVQGSQRIRTMTFVKRASEIMDAEYVELTMPDNTVIERKARQILVDLDRISLLSDEIDSIRRELENKILSQRWIEQKKNELAQAKHEYMEMIESLKGEIIYHKEKYTNLIGSLNEELDRTVEQLAGEIIFHLGEKVQCSREAEYTPVDEEDALEFVERCYRYLIRRGGDGAGIEHWVNVITSGQETPNQVFMDFWTSKESRAADMTESDKIDVFYWVYRDRAPTKTEYMAVKAQLDGGVTLEEVNSHFVYPEGRNTEEVSENRNSGQDQKRFEMYDCLSKALQCSKETLKKIIRQHFDLPEAEVISDTGEDAEAYDAMIQLVCTEHYPESLWDCESFHDLKNRVDQLVREIDMYRMYLSELYTDETITEDTLKRVREEHTGRCVECEEDNESNASEEERLGRDSRFYHMIEDLSYNALEECELFQDKLERYKSMLKDLERLEQERIQLEETHREVEEQDIVDAYCQSFLLKDDKGNPIKKLLKEDPTDCFVLQYSDELIQRYYNDIEERRWLLEIIYCLDVTTNDIGRTIRNFLSSGLNAKMEDFKINHDRLDLEEPHPRALPSVRLMGEGSEAVYLPTDTAPSRVFNYSMLQRLVEPEIAKNDTVFTRAELNHPIDVMKYKEDLYNAPRNVPVATSLGIGYVLNMHQAWIPDGFALGNLLYSLVLAPGEEQRLIIREHSESYTVNDEASALDTINDSYRNSQIDNEDAAFHQAANRFSSAHSDYSYTSTAKSKGSSGIHLLFGLSASSKASSVNSGSGSSNASQVDNYDEVSSAAQSFQTEIKTESNRLASAKRASIRVASSNEADSVSSKIIANHNHSHVMTVQYWEVTRRYRMETAIESIDLVLFVPMKMISFLPGLNDEPYFAVGNEKLTEEQRKKYRGYQFPVTKYTDFTKNVFAYRYSNLLRYSDILLNAVPARYRGGLNLIKQFSAYPEWEIERYNSQGSTLKVKVVGNLIDADQLSATLCFQNGMAIEGCITDSVCPELSPSLNTRRDVLYGLKKIRSGKNATRSQKTIAKNARTDRFNFSLVKPEESYVVFTFYLSPQTSKHDISHITLENNLTDWEWRLSQSTEYMEDSERIAIKRYEHWKYNYSHDTKNNRSDAEKIEHYQEGLPECYTNPIVRLSRSELLSLGALSVSLYCEGQTNSGEDFSGTAFATGRLDGGKIRFPMNQLVPTLGYDELMEIEDALHHIVAQTLRYSQAVWESLSDNERIMMLEQYSIDMNSAVLSNLKGQPDENDENERRTGSGLKATPRSKPEPLLNCVNAKKLIGFYGNCMLLPFTFPQSLAESLKKTAGEVQDELYRYHTTNFRVPSTVISVPTDGMVGEAVLSATNVSEKIDITRFWNWKDSDIDHINIDQNYFNNHSLLDRADTKSVDAPTVGVTPTEHIAGNNLAAALLARQQPTFADALANTDIRELLMSTDKNASAGRESIVAANTDMVKSTINAATDIAKAVATGGVSLAGGALGDTDVIKSALSSIGLSDGDAEALVNKVSSGKMNTSDFVQSVANSIKKKGSSTPPAQSTPPGDGTGGGGDENPSNPVPEGEPDDSEPVNTQPGNEPGIGDPENQKPGNETDPDKHTEDNQDRKDKNDAMEELFGRMLESIKKGESAVDFFNREYKSPTGEPFSLDEINSLADAISEENGYQTDELLSALAQDQ